MTPVRRMPAAAIFVIGLVGLAVLEIANVYFIMPMPGSQRMRSVEFAYAVYSWRWWVRGGMAVLIVAGAASALRAAGWRRWLAVAGALVTAGLTYQANFVMAADHMFLQPTRVIMEPAERNRVAQDRLVVGVERNGEARAYPLQFIGYHHQVRDTVGGVEVLVSYCTVCRTGRVFSPVISGTSERFRLVGMDHFNAMLEDQTTGSWWRQANGEAVAGARSGDSLEELPSTQVTLAQWLALHPRSLIMQGDPAFTEEYAKDYSFENGTSQKTLTGTDASSWGDKSWVVGVSLNGQSKAFDWNRFKRERVVNDEVGGVPIVLVLGPDNASFFAYKRPDAATRFELRGDSLMSGAAVYAISGRGPTGALAPVQASQEFWHSWRTFQPATERW